MTQKDPAARPTMSEAFESFKPIYAARDRLQHRRRLQVKGESRIGRAYSDLAYSLYDGVYLWKQFLVRLFSFS